MPQDFLNCCVFNNSESDDSSDNFIAQSTHHCLQAMGLRLSGLSKITKCPRFSSHAHVTAKSCIFTSVGT